ncbi:MAG: hypothetical protein Q8928_04715 [Bacteroidota bacterium]|nr:hypothetical protein [Bacteroidota bacterium]
MKKAFLTTIVACISFQLFAQVKIEVPYEWGQVLLTAQITYPKTIVTADSVRLEATYQGDLVPVKEFIPLITVKNRPLTISPKFNFEHNGGTQSYRCIVYQKGKKAVISDTATFDYGPYKYDTTALAKVKNVQYQIINKKDKRYIHLFWDAVPNALGYMVAMKNDMNYYGFQLAFGGPMSKTSNTFLDIPVEGDGPQYYGVCGIQNPNDFQPSVDMLTLITVEIPAK